MFKKIFSSLIFSLVFISSIFAGPILCNKSGSFRIDKIDVIYLTPFSEQVESYIVYLRENDCFYFDNEETNLAKINIYCKKAGINHKFNFIIHNFNGYSDLDFRINSVLTGMVLKASLFAGNKVVSYDYKKF